MKLKSLALSSLLISSSVMAHDGMKYDDPYAREHRRMLSIALFL